MFIRIKKIKNQHYAYKVRNKWTRKGTRQKTTGYLGKVYTLEQAQSISFEEYIKNDLAAYLRASSSKQIIRDLIALELINHGFAIKNYVLQKDGIIVDLNHIKVSSGKKNVVLNINQDFLAEYTLKNLLKFHSHSDEEECGKELAKAFISAGIPVRPDIFVEVFRKVFDRKGQSMVK